MTKFQTHVIHRKTGQMLVCRGLDFVPSVGDEIRLEGNRFYKVSLVVWVFDEPDSYGQRVNVGVDPVTVGDPA